MSDYDDWIDEMRRKRDELKLQMHLAGKEAEDELDQMLKDWAKFVEKAQLEKSAEEVGEAARELGLRMKTAFDRLRKG